MWVYKKASFFELGESEDSGFINNNSDEVK